MFGRDFFEPSETAIATFLERDIALVIDRSGSMAGQKFRDLRTALDVFAATLALGTVEERVGMASYATFSSEDLELTTDLRQIGQTAGRLPIDGFTSISSGMVAGGNVLSRGRNRDFVERSMLVMTDGIHNFGAEPEVVANTLAAQGIVIHTITFGADADIRRMQNVARIGKGISLQANSGAQLQEAFRQIALTLNTVLTE
jgi:Mg-chelatase subunit ChlD